MKLHKEFNQYLADLAVMTIKLHNLHWNVKGMQFVPIHQLTESLYDTTFEYYDAVAEHEKMYDAIPDSKMSDYLANARIKEIDPKAFTAEEVLEILINDIGSLRETATNLRNACDAEGWFSAVGMFEEHVAYYNKQLWFIKATAGK